MKDNEKAILLTVILFGLVLYGYKRYQANKDQKTVDGLKQQELSTAVQQTTSK